MAQKRFLQRYGFVVAFVVLCGIVLFGPRAVDVLASNRAPEQALRDAWQNALNAASYSFTTDLSQTTGPRASGGQVGRLTEPDNFYLKGMVRPDERTLEMTLWSEGGSVLDSASGMEMRIDGEQAYARMNGSEWEEIPNFTGFIAPENDLLAYLSAAEDVHRLAQSGADSLTGYGYTISGPKFAAWVTGEMQSQLARSGKILPEMQLSIPDTYARLEGSGELWIGADGYPRRQVLHLSIPTGEGSVTRAEASMDFSAFEVAPGTAAAGGTFFSPGALAEGARAAQEQGVPLLLAAALLFAMLRLHRNRAFQAAMTLVVIASMVATPLLQSVKAASFAQEQAAKQQQASQQEEKSKLQTDLEQLLGQEDNLPADALNTIRTDTGLDSDQDGLSNVAETFLQTNPYSDSIPTAQETDAQWLAADGVNAAALDAEDDTDSDADGLTDYEETLLGTSSVAEDADGDGVPEGRDTDGDGISDFDEVNGFAYQGKTYTTNPLQQDTNKDNQADGREWKLPGSAHDTWDTDGDGTPDVADDDNDNDAVPDLLDLSPYVRNDTVFSKNNPFGLALTGLEPEMTSLVEVQVRPTDPNHLRYAYNVLDWPEGDYKGQMQDVDGKTFYDLDPSLPASPNDNGDVKLLPMLQVTIRGSSSGLPLIDRAPALNVSFNDVSGTGSNGSVYLMPNGSDSVIAEVKNMVSGLRYGIHNGPCNSLGSRVRDLGEASSTSMFSWSGMPLETLLDGKHSITASRPGSVPPSADAIYTCATLPKNPREGAKWIDTDLLSRYGVTVSEGKTANEWVLYAPLYLVSQKGNNNVAFQARLLYRPSTAGWSQPHQVRVVWMVEALVDRCRNAYYDMCYALNQQQTIFTYDSDFYLTGLNIREDYGADAVAINEMPVKKFVTNLDLNQENELLLLAHALDQSFIAGRDCAQADENAACAADGKVDLTPAELEQRLKNGSSRPNWQRWGTLNVFNARRQTYRTLDEMRARATRDLVTPTLNADYKLAQLDFSVYRPTVLIASQDTYRAANLDAQQTGDGQVAWNGANLTLNVGASALITNNSLVAHSYEKTGDATWRSLTAEEVWNQFESTYTSQVSDENDAEIQAGSLVLAKIFYLSLTQSISNIVAINGSAISTLYQTDGDLVRQIGSASGKIVGGAVKFLVNNFLKLMYFGVDGMLYGPSFTLKYLSAFARGATPFSNTIGKIGQWFSRGQWTVGKTLAAGSIAVVAAALVSLAITAGVAVAAHYLGGADWAAIPAGLVVAGLTILFATVLPILQVGKAIYNIAKETGDLINSIGMVLNGTCEVLHQSVLGALVGMVIQIAFTWGAFLVQWAMGAFAFGSAAFNDAIAMTIASTVLAVICFVISLSVAGSLIIGMLSGLDAILSLLCNTFKVEGTCFSLSGLVTELMKDAFYGYSPTFDSDNTQLLSIEGLTMDLYRPELNMIPGNSVRVTVQTNSHLEQKLQGSPEQQDRLLYNGQGFFGPKALQDSTFNIAINGTPAVLEPGKQYNQWNNVDLLKSLRIKSGAKWFDLKLYKGDLPNVADSGWMALPKAEINHHIPVALNMAYSLPAVDCWLSGAISICSLKPITGTSMGEDMGLAVDVFPADLNTFAGWHWDSKLPAPMDWDNDGALSVAVGGPDFEDARWDYDGDGLADGYEMDPAGVFSNHWIADTDHDGLSDGQEVMLGTNPVDSDTDHDTLDDGAEVHGWQFTYAPGKSTLVTADPLNPDTDGDGLSDRLERDNHLKDPVKYPYSPRVDNHLMLELKMEIVGGKPFVQPGQSVAVRVSVAYDKALGDDVKVSSALTTDMFHYERDGAFYDTQPYWADPIPSWKNCALNYGQTCELTSTYAVAANKPSETYTARGELSYHLYQIVGGVSQWLSDTYDLHTDLALIVDGLQPAAQITSLEEGVYLPAQSRLIIGGTAGDTGDAGVERVEVQVDGGAWQAAEGAESWSYDLLIPAAEGQHTLRARAIDHAGNVQAAPAALGFVVDASDPVPTVSNPAADAHARMAANPDKRFRLHLEGSVADPAVGGLPGAGVQSVEVRVMPYGADWQMAALKPDGSWSLEYLLPAILPDGTDLTDPSGPTSIEMRTTDVIGNRTAESQPFTHAIQVDNIAPQFTVDYPWPGRTYAGEGGQIIEAKPVGESDVLGTQDEVNGTVQEDGVVTTGVSAMEVRLVAHDQSVEPGYWQAQYNIAGKRQDDMRTGQVETIDFAWGVDDLKALNPSFTTTRGFQAIFERAALLRTGGVYTIHAKSTEWDDVRVFVDGELALEYLDNELWQAGEEEVDLRLDAGMHSFRVEYIHHTVIEDPALRVDIDLKESDWLPTTLDQSGAGVMTTTWRLPVPAHLEGTYHLDARGVDTLDNRAEKLNAWTQWQGEVDTEAPRVSVQMNYTGYGASTRTVYDVMIQDYHLTEDGLVSPCPVEADDRINYMGERWQEVFDGLDVQQLYILHSTCSVAGRVTEAPVISAKDTFGNTRNLTVSLPLETDNRSVYWTSWDGTNSAIERYPLDSNAAISAHGDPHSGQAVLDVAVLDDTLDRIFVAGAASVWAENVDGSGRSVLSASGAEKISVSATRAAWVTNSAEKRLMIANLDGSAAISTGLTGISALDFDPQNNVLVVAQPVAGQATYAILFVDPSSGNLLGKMEPTTMPGDAWVTIEDLAVEPASAAKAGSLYLAGSFGWAGIRGVVRVAYNLDDLARTQTGLVRGQMVWRNDKIADVALDLEAGKVYFTARYTGSQGPYAVLYRMDRTGINEETLVRRDGASLFGLGLTSNRQPAGEDWTVVARQNQAVSQALAVNANDSDLLRYVVETAPAHGALSGLPTGLTAAPVTLTYTPATDYLGADTFLLRVEDVHGSVIRLNGAVTVKEPLVAAVQITAPAEGQWISNPGALSVSARYEAEAGARSLELRVDGALVDSQNLPDPTDPGDLALAWASPSEGQHTLTVTLTDAAGNTRTASRTVTVDRTEPTLTIDTTTARGSTPQVIGFGGQAQDAGQVAAVEVAVGSLTAARMPASLNADGTWSVLYTAPAMPSGDLFDVFAWAVDAAGNRSSTPAYRAILVDHQAPQPVALTLRHGSRLLSAGVVVAEAGPRLAIAWTPPTDPSGVTKICAGWTEAAEATLDEVSCDISGASYEQVIAGTSKAVYAHLYLEDGAGNGDWQHAGPVILDDQPTPDLLSSPALPGGVSLAWMSSGATLLGEQTITNGGVSTPQGLYASWNNSHLALAWASGDWLATRDVFFYLDINNQTGGANVADNPYAGSTETVQLPQGMSAEYAVWLKSDSAQLVRFENGAWNPVKSLPVAALAETAARSVLVAFEDLGIASPATTGLSLVAFSTPEDALRARSVFPINNPAWAEGMSSVSLLHAYQWNALAGGVLPNQNRYLGGIVSARLFSQESRLATAAYLSDQLYRYPGFTLADSADANQDGLFDVAPDAFLRGEGMLGASSAVDYILTVSNSGPAELRGLTAELQLSGLALRDGQAATLDLGDLAAGEARSVALKFQMDLRGRTSTELRVVVRDASGAALDWLYALQAIDTSTPAAPVITAPAAASYVRSYPELVEITGTSDSNTRRVTANVNYVNRPGIVTTARCSAPNAQGVFTCPLYFDWIEGEARVTVQAVNSAGNASPWSAPLRLFVDRTAPALTVTTDLANITFDGYASLAGTLVDAGAGMPTLDVCIDAQHDTCLATGITPAANGEWSYDVPLPDDWVGEFFHKRLYLFAQDGIGNRAVQDIFVWIDTVGPTILLTDQDNLETHMWINAPWLRVFQFEVTGGASVVTADVTLPDGSTVVETLPFQQGDSRTYWPSEPRQPGSYTLTLHASDRSGHEAVGGPYTTLIRASADLGITLTADATRAALGRPVTYTIAVDNAGPDTAMNTALKLTLPADADFQSSTCAGGSAAGGVFTWPAGALPNGESRACNVTVVFARNTTASPQAMLEVASDAVLCKRPYIKAYLALVANRPPAVILNPQPDYDGYYIIPEGSSLTLDASGSTDPDGSGGALSFAWDLDGDGVFETSGAQATLSAIGRNGPDALTPQPRVRVTDAEGGETVRAIQAQISNVRPSGISFSADPGWDVNMGEEVTLTATFTDPGKDCGETYTYTWEVYGAENMRQNGASVTFTLSGLGTYQVMLTVKDSDGGFFTEAATLRTVNPPPVITALTVDSPSPSEGQQVEFEVQFTDAGPASQGLWAEWDFGDGASTTGGFVQPHRYDQDGEYNVTVTVNDNYGGSDTRTLVVSVQNSAPRVTLGVSSKPETLVEGSEVAFTGAAADASNSDPLSFEWDFGDGAKETQTLQPRHTFADDGPYTVRLSATDDDVTASETLAVNIANAAPTLSELSGRIITPDRLTVELSFRAADPGLNDALTLAVDWQDGSGVETLPVAQGMVNIRHAYAQEAQYGVTLRLSDGDGGLAEQTVDVATGYTPPQAAVNIKTQLPLAAQERQMFRGGYVDFDGLEQPTMWEWDFGDGSPADTTSWPHAFHTYANPGNYTLTLTVTDEDGKSDTTTLALTIYEPRPVIDLGPDLVVKEGEAVTIHARINGSDDPSGYDLVWTFEQQDTPSGSLTATHTFADNHRWPETVGLTATRRSDGMEASRMMSVTVENVAPAFGALQTNGTLTPGQPSTVEVSVPFTDPGSQDGGTLAIDWQDGSAVEEIAYAAGTRQLTLTHTYLSPGRRGEQAVLILTDKDGDSARQVLHIPAANQFWLYLPFVTR